MGWDESFTYDNLDRLTNAYGPNRRAQQYDARGRITFNSNIGNYTYAANNLYRLQGVDLNAKGDLHYQNQPLQKIKYNAYKKPVSIAVKDKAKVDFEYGILQNRSHAYFGGNQENKLDRRYQKHYSAIAPIEIEVDNQGNTKIITYIGGDAYSAPVVHIKQTASGSANGYHYLHRDYLGSILAISDSSGTVQEQRQFGAWGGVDKFKSLNSEIDFEYSTTLLNRGYTGHEHFADVGLIHMNGRMYDAELGRFLSPDNYIQEPFSTQSFNRYGYVLNNPLKYTDHSGEFFFTAILVGALIGATAGAVGYIVNAAITGNWSWSGFGQAILGGAISGAIAGVIGPTALFKSILTNGFWGTAAIVAASSFLPSVDVKIGDWSFGVSPALAFGRATGFGANISVSYQDGDFNFSAGYGVTFYGSAHGTGKKGWEQRVSGSIGSNGTIKFSAYTTYFDSGPETSQQVGGLSLGHGEWNIRYENDFIEKPLKYVGEYLADGKDRFRTAALQLSYKDYSVGLKFFTGDPLKGEQRDKSNPGAKYGIYDNPEADKYRLGSVLMGYKGYQAGYHNEAIRGAIQNKFVHNKLTDGSGWFRELPGRFPSHSYFQYQSYNPYTLW